MYLTKQDRPQVFTDADGDELIITTTGLPPGLNMDAAGTLHGTPTAAGSYTVTVTGSDGYATASTSFVITINAVAAPNRAPVRNHTPQTISLQLSDSGGSGETVYWPLDAFVDPDGNPMTYQLINSPAWVYYSFNPGQFGGHSFGLYPPGQNRSYTVTVRATDHLGAYVDMSFNVIVQYQPGGGGVPLSQPGGGVLSFDMGAESSVQGPQSQLTVDENGQPTANAVASTPTPIDVRDYWFTYDAENRIRINNGRLINNQIVLVAEGGDSYQLSYDAGGNAITRVFYRGNNLKVQRSDYDLRGNRTIEYHEQAGGIPGYMGVARVFSYDANRRQLGSRSYYELGTIYTYTSRPGEMHEEYDSYDVSGWLTRAENVAYDADGRLIYQENWTRNDDWQGWVRSAAQNNADGKQSTDTSVLNVRNNRVDYLDANGQSTYDSTGKASSFRQFAPGYVHTFTTTYQGWETYQEKLVSGSSSDNNYKATTNTLSYDAYGRLISQTENTRLKNGTIDDRVRYYAYNGDGQVQTRREGTIKNGQFTQSDTVKPNYVFAYAGGQQMAQIREGQKGIVSLSGMGMYEAGGAKVTAMPGETLRQLAQRVYGNDQLWYVLAQANGLGDPDQEIGSGLQLEAPRVDVSRNDASTFKPYNPAESVGSTTPGLPYIAPPAAGCSSMAKLIVLVVVIAVAAFTGGAILAALPTAGTLGLGTAMFIGGVAGAAGALAGQAVGSVLGVSSFSWRAVAAGAVTGAITGGIAELAGGISAGAGSTAEGAKQAVTATARFGKVAAQAIGNPLAAYAGDKIAGLDTSFSWRNIVASSVTNVIASYAGPAISDGLRLDSNFSRNFAQGMTAGVVSAATRNVMGMESRSNFRSIISDAFGNALGNLIGSGGAYSYDTSLANDGDASEPENSASSSTDSGRHASNPSGTWDGLGLALGYGFETGSGLIDVADRGSNNDRSIHTAGYVVGAYERGAENLDVVLVTTNERFNQFYMNLWDWSTRYSQSGLTASTYKGATGIANYWAERTASLTPGYAQWLRNSAAIPIGGGPIQSQNTLDARQFDLSRNHTKEYYDSFRGSWWGDVGANAGTIFSHAGIGIAQGANSVYNVFTDKRSRDEAIAGSVQVAFNPIDTYWQVVGATSDFMGMPSDDQWRIIGTGAVGFVATAGVDGLVTRGLTVGGRALHSAVDALDAAYDTARVVDRSVSTAYQRAQILANLRRTREGNSSGNFSIHVANEDPALSGIAQRARVDDVVPNNALTIAANPATGNPAAISRGFGTLNSRQSAVLEQLPEFGSSTITHKSFGQRDLSALTAATGDEFAMFSTGGRRMIFRGDAGSVPINPEMASQLADQGWRWSSHTHPSGAGVLRSSMGDRAVLDAMGGQRSSIFNSMGNEAYSRPRAIVLKGGGPNNEQGKIAEAQGNGSHRKEGYTRCPDAIPPVRGKRLGEFDVRHPNYRQGRSF